MKRASKTVATLLVGLGLAAGCQDRSAPPVAQSTVRRPDPDTKPSQTPAPATSQKAATAVRPSSPVPRRDVDEGLSIWERRPRRPKDTWVIFREAFDGQKDASCTTKWLERNRFEMRTENVRRLTLDMTRLPKGAPRKGPWIVIIDGQGVELTGFRPKPGYTGNKRDLVRSKNGKWTVDRRKLYRPGE